MSLENNSFPRYVFQAYENGEFEMPEIELIGPIENYFEGTVTPAALHVARKFVDATVEVSYSKNETFTHVNEGEIMLREGSDGSRTIMWDDGKDFHIVGYDAYGHHVAGSDYTEVKPIEKPVEKEKPKSDVDQWMKDIADYYGKDEQ